MHITSKFILPISLILLFICTGTAISADDPYLQALEAEAEDSNNINKTPVTHHTETSQPLPDADSLQIAERQKEFTARLSKELPATTRAYNKLSIENKVKVIDSYFNSDRNMTMATRLLFNLYFKTKHLSNEE